MTHSKLTEALSRRDEERLVKASQRILLGGGYPNPDRVGCPEGRVLKALAERKIEAHLAEQSIVHIGSCSPCFSEYTAFQKQQARRHVIEFALAGAAVLVLAVLVGWLWKAEGLKGPEPNFVATAPQKVTVDLRNRLVFRDEAPPSTNSGPVQLERERLDLTMLLSPDNKVGSYQVQVFKASEKPLTVASGVAVNQDGATSLNVKLDLSKVSPGTYILGVGSSDGRRREFPLIVK